MHSFKCQHQQYSEQLDYYCLLHRKLYNTTYYTGRYVRNLAFAHKTKLVHILQNPELLLLWIKYERARNAKIRNTTLLFILRMIVLRCSHKTNRIAQCVVVTVIVVAPYSQSRNNKTATSAEFIIIILSI